MRLQGRLRLQRSFQFYAGLITDLKYMHWLPAQYPLAAAATQKADETKADVSAGRDLKVSQRAALRRQSTTGSHEMLLSLPVGWPRT